MSFVVSERVFDLFLQRINVAIRVGRGAIRRRGGPVANAEVLGIL